MGYMHVHTLDCLVMHAAKRHECSIAPVPQNTSTVDSSTIQGTYHHMVPDARHVRRHAGRGVISDGIPTWRTTPTPWSMVKNHMQ